MEVVHLTVGGALVRLMGPMVFVGEFYNLQFQFPVNRAAVSAQVRVVNTNDKVVSKDRVERFAELHFRNLTDDNRARIVTSFTLIGQA